MGIPLLELVIPGAGHVSRALATASSLCRGMAEAQPACDRLHSRLANLLAELKRVETTETMEASTSSLNRYTAVVATFLKLLQRHSGRSLIYRVARHKSIVDMLHEVTEDVEELFRELLDVDVVNWGDQWEADCQLQDAEIEAAIKDNSVVLSDLQSSRARADAWLTLKFEVERRSELQNEKTTRWMKAVVETIAAVVKTSGGALPEWYLPEYEVQVEAKPFRPGCVGSLHRGVLLSSGVSVVVKRFSVDELLVDEHVQLELDREFETLRGLEHPNVVKTLGGSHVGSPPFIVYEDAMDGDLRSFLNRSEENKERMYTLLHEAAMGLDYLHRQGVVHGKLQLSNIFVNGAGHVQLAEFGVESLHPYSASGRGNLRWRAPECLAGPSTFASDVYSLAMCMIEAATNQPPFAGLDDSSVREQVKSGVLPSRPDSMADEAWELVVCMTRFAPEKRVSLESVVDKLRLFAARESVVTLNSCCACAASVSAEWKFCSQCGTQLPLSTPSPELTEDLSVLELVAATRTESAARQDQALLLLVQACINDYKRREVYVSDVILTLVDLVENGRTHFAQVCALQCLSMEKTPELISSYSDGKILAMGRSIPVMTPQECTLLVDALMNGSCQNKLKAGIHCAGAIIANRGKGLQRAGAVEALITLLKGDDEPPKFWSALALAHLADHDVNWRTLMKKNVTQSLESVLQIGNEVQKAFATWSLCRLAVSDATDDLEGKEDLISLLVSLLDVGNDNQKLLATSALLDLSSCNTIRAAVTSAGAVPPLMAILQCGTREQKDIGARLCAALAVGADSRLVIVEEAGVQVAVELLRVGSDVQKEQSARVLACLTVDEDGSIAVATEGCIPPVVELLRFGITEQKEQAAKVLVNLTLYERSRDLVARKKVIPTCVEFLRCGNEKLKEYAALVLANLAHSAKDRCTIAESGAIACLVTLLRGGTPSQRESAVWALANLSVDKKNRSLIAAAGGITALKALLQRGTDNQKGQTARTLANLTLDQDCREEIAREGCIPVFVGLLRSGDEKPKEQTLRALTNMAVSLNSRRIMVQSGCVTCFVGLLRDGTAGQKLHTVRAVALLTIDVENRDAIARAGGIPPLVNLAWVGNDVQRELSTCALANLSVSVESRIAIVREGACLPLIALLCGGTEKQKEFAAKTFANLAINGDNRRTIASAGAISPLINLLRDGTVKQQAEAARALGNLAINNDANRVEMENKGATPWLKTLSQTATNPLKRNAATALENIETSKVSKRMRDHVQV